MMRLWGNGHNKTESKNHNCKMCEHSVERLQALLRTMSVTWMSITDTQRAYTVDMTKSDDSVAKWRERGKTARGGEERQARKKKTAESVYL